jgi:hypothetical protein
MQNDRPIEDPRLHAALQAVLGMAREQDLACAVMLVNENEAAFGYQMYTTWNCVSEDDSIPLGFRFRLKTAEQGVERAHQLALGTGHMLHQLKDFGTQTQIWMQDLIRLLRKAGMSFEHSPFNGRRLPRLTDTPPSPR